VSTDISERGNCLVVQTFQRTDDTGYIKTFKELPGFKEEPVVIWLIQIRLQRKVK
jgi:hypothetical protein